MALTLSDPVPRDARLEHAFDAGLALPTTGRIGVWRAGGADLLTRLPQERVHVIQGFRPDHDALTQAGFAVSPMPEGRYALALVCLPRAKTHARALIAESAALSDGLVLVDGQKSDGADAVLREVRARVEVLGTVSRAHGKAFWFRADAAALADWAAVPATVTDAAGARFVTAPGVFSADAADPGSALLAAALPEGLGPTVVDLGAGWGYLGTRLLRDPSLRTLHVVEAEHAALDCARANLADPRARFHWADATRFTLPDPADTVVMNPPFHTGRAARAELGLGFIDAAARLLGPGGALWMVANRHLPYPAALQARFREVTIAVETPAFRVYRAAQPHPAAPRRRRRA